jgi:hypothetical protein
MIPDYIFLIEGFLTIKELDNCILLNKDTCREIVNSNVIIKRRHLHMINSQQVIINAYLLNLKKSAELENDGQSVILVNNVMKEIKKRGYQNWNSQFYIDIFVKNSRDSLYKFIRNEFIITKIKNKIACLNYLS